MQQTPWLLTPGPLTTSMSVKRAMLRDWGSRDGEFIAMNRRIRDRLLALAGAGEDYVCVPMQGSGTFAIEAAIATLLPRDGKLLVLVNGAYGLRMCRIATVMGRSVGTIEAAEDVPVSPASLDQGLAADAAITHVAVVQCETTSGILNPVEAVAEVCALHRRALLIDAMSAFGALPIDARRLGFEAVVASSNKCLEGVPGVGFVIVRRRALERAKGASTSLSLDLEDQWRGLEGNGQWRFTPPTHVLAALDQALDEHEAEGGVNGRGARYRRNHAVLVEGMAAMGFETLVPRALQAPIIVTFRMPADPAFVFETFYDRLREKGFVIYPGKLTVAPSFRIGCIGRLGEAEMLEALAAIRDTMAEMGVASGAPALVEAIP
ncbi:MAG: 2-aminoethylphosphonate--pyruvate transaminase [Rhodospirillales bacterium]|jgi:2-aminoethylphosphonate-pyruvate transaminase|nr:2-aminoethylphosphonate--pyruvate transaminase [Rhodospirillales bacterium]